MKRFFAIILIVFTVLVASCSELFAGRRPPTETENRTYLPIVQLWLGANWEKIKVYDKGEYIAQKITEVSYCCIDDDGGRHIHIVDIKFHAKFYDRDRLIEEKDMAQRILFRCADGRIVDWDPLPAYKLEEIT